MKHNYLKILVVVYISLFCLVITPFYGDNLISATGVIKICDWDDVASGLDNGTCDYLTWTNLGTSNNFETTTDNDLSPPNSFKIKSENGKPVNGYWNLTSSIGYIGVINFSFVSVNSGDYIFMNFTDDDDGIVISIRFSDNIGWYDVSSGWKSIYLGIDGNRHYFLFTHNSTNQFNINIYDSTFGLQYSYDYAGAYAGNYNNFDYVKWSSDGGYLTETVCFDEFYVDTSWNWSSEPPLGYLGVNCFDETNGSNITGFSFIAANYDGDTYYDYNLNNTYIVAGAILPQGDCTITVSATNYYSRSYVIDVEDGYFVINGITYYNATIDFYLPPINLSLSYIIRVVDDYNNPLNGVYVHIVRAVNYSSSAIDIGSAYTDSYGNTQWVLIATLSYMIHCSKSGYNDVNITWIPPYTENYTYTIQMNQVAANYTNETIIPGIITFNGYLSGNYLYVNYTDTDLNTTNTSIVVNEINQSTNLSTPIYWDNRSGNNSFQLNITVNGSNCFYVKLYLNHSVFGFQQMSFLVCGLVPYRDITNKTFFDNIFTLNYGASPGGMGWSNFFGFIIMVAGLFSFGQRNCGISLLLTGFVLLFVNSVIGLSFIGVTIPVLFIILGALVEWININREGVF